jgi:DNA modification methylase
MDSRGEDYQQEIDETADEIQVKKQERQQLRADRVDSYAFENTPFESDDEESSTVHKEAPVVLDEAGNTLDAADGFGMGDFEVAVFFHDNRQMGLEVPDSVPDEELPGFFHLMFFSPPYFDQSGTMPVDQWLPERTDSIADEETLDATYENYLDWLLERIEVFARKLKPGRALIINVSDTSTSNLDELDKTRFGDVPQKRYDIPSDLSARIRREVEALRYDSTIQWMRQQTTSQRGGQYWSRSSDDINDGKPGYPLYYYPQDATEELLIFRKEKKPDHEAIRTEAASRFDREFGEATTFRNEVRFESPSKPFNNCIAELSGEFDDPRNNVWKIAPQTDDWAHDAAFPRKLARLIIQLFTLPGERIADPFGGYATTLREVQSVNNKRPELPNRQGFAWENFSSEQVGQDDYRENVHDVLAKTGLAGFGQPLSAFS